MIKTQLELGIGIVKNLPDSNIDFVFCFFSVGIILKNQV